MSAARSTLRAEFDAEMHSTRLVLAATPRASADWRPHPRSMPLAGLAAHLADLPRWIPRILGSDHYDVAGSRPPSVSVGGTGVLLATFDANVAIARGALDAAGSEVLEARWELRRGAVVTSTFTRAQSVRIFVVHHAVHHRGQLAMYLRLLDVAVPRIHGPAPPSA
jgi:uncharacterized damage-inducible protein DinB